jgi:PAS domain-containing protein
MNLHMNGNDAREVLGRPYPEMQNLPEMRSTRCPEPPALLLDESGHIQDCSKSVESLFGYGLGELVWQHISCLFPQFSDVALLHNGQIDAKLNFISRCGHTFMGLTRRGDTIPFHLSFIRFERDGLCTLRLILRPSGSAKA